MESKIFEVLDRATFMPVCAVRLNPSNRAEGTLLLRSGFREPSKNAPVLLCHIYGGHGAATADSGEWETGRTTTVAHRHIIENWDRLESGAVIDVEFLLGETDAPKPSEAAQ